MNMKGNDMSLIEASIISNKKSHSKSLGNSIEVLSYCNYINTTSIAIPVIIKTVYNTYNYS